MVQQQQPKKQAGHLVPLLDACLQKKTFKMKLKLIQNNEIKRATAIVIWFW